MLRFLGKFRVYYWFLQKKTVKDQVADYAERKDFGLEEAERWLAPVLNYDV
jgi:5-methyltetrahydrofolate--homocysteine methyltransferase